jgi:hypothetical protein
VTPGDDASRAMTVQRVRAPGGRVAVELHYPKPVVHEDVGEPPPDSNASLTARPGKVKSGGAVTFLVDGHRRTANAGPGGVFTTHAASGAKVRIPAGAARDRFGNHNGRPLRMSG